MRHFNTAGPCFKENHYMIETSTRLKGVEKLIDMAQYFVIHAPLQSGKTTYLLTLEKAINAKGNYYALYCSLESLQQFTDPKQGIPEILKLLKTAIANSNIPNKQDFAENPDFSFYTGLLENELILFCKKISKPLIIFFDDVDKIKAKVLIPFLSQIRVGFNTRSMYSFVHSMALVGLRPVKNYTKEITDECKLDYIVPFNIVAETMMLKNFTKEEITLLYQQHTDDTGQLFENETIDYIFEQTQGHPWLVNAIAKEVIEEILKSDYSQPITAEMAKTAIQTILQRRDTHIDHLVERLKEKRVRNIIDSMISGETFFDRLSDNFQYVVDTGLINDLQAKVQPSNPIYEEVIARYFIE